VRGVVVYYNCLCMGFCRAEVDVDVVNTFPGGDDDVDEEVVDVCWSSE